MPSSVEREYAMQCGCGEILAQVDEPTARTAVASFNEHRIADMHGPAKLVYRKVITSDWRTVSDPTSP